MSGSSHLKCHTCGADLLLNADSVVSAAEVATFTAAHLHEEFASSINFELTLGAPAIPQQGDPAWSED